MSASSTPTMQHYARLDSNSQVMSVGAMPAGLPLPNGCSAITEQQAAQVRAGSTWALQSGALIAAARTIPLAALQGAATRQIDAQAEEARLAFITPGVGQAMTYQRKATEAAAFLAQYQTAAAAANATASAWPMLEAEVSITAADLFGVASAIVAKSGQWTTIAATIEKTRLAAKAKIAAATGQADITAALAVTWPTP